VNLILDTWQLLFLIFFKPSSSLIGSEPSVVLDVKAFLIVESNWQFFCCSFYIFTHCS